MANQNIAPEVRSGNNPQVGSTEDRPFNPYGYQSSSAAISFAALMEVLKAYQDMRNSTAKTSEAVSQVKCNTALNQADSTFNSYQADADMLGFQACEAWGQVAASSVQLAATGVQYGMCSESAKNRDAMDNLAGNVKTNLNRPELEIGEGLEGREHGPYTKEETELLEQHKKEILDGFRPDNYKQGLDSKLAEGSDRTLRDVFETASKEQFSDLRKAITKAQKNAHSQYQSQQSYAQMVSQALNALGQGAASTNSAIYKQGGESSATLDKAKAAQQQAYAAASKEFADETYKSMQQLMDQGTQGTEKVFQYMAQMVAQDTRA